MKEKYYDDPKENAAFLNAEFQEWKLLASILMKVIPERI